LGQSYGQKGIIRERTKENKTMERKGFVVAALVTVCLILFVGAPYVEGGSWQPWNRLDGAWLRTTTDPASLDAGVKSIIVLTPRGPFAREAAFRGSFINPDPATIPPGGFATDFVGEAVMTGPSTYEATGYSYIMMPNPSGGRDLVFAILVGVTSGTFVNNDKVEGVQSGSIYLGIGGSLAGLGDNQDVDGDLIPDEGLVPWKTIGSVPLVDRRTPMVP
jgi:hypothetical protein